GLLRSRNALERASLTREALAVGVEPTLDLDELRVLIDQARDFIERKRLSVRLGVTFDDRAIADAQRELQRRADSLELRQVEREAIHFGLAIDERGVEQLQADIADAQDAAQAFADDLRGRGMRSEALALGISLDGKSPQQIEDAIAELRVSAQEFIQAHPIEADLLRSAVDDGSRAIAQFVTGAKSGKEALRDFFASMAAQAAQAAAQLLIVKTLIAAFGNTPGFGSFLSTLLPGASARGNAFAPDGGVLALARGGAIEAGLLTGTASASVGGAASFFRRSSDAPLWTAPTYVERYAMGGSPWIDKIVDGPTLERSQRLAGSAIVPLSGGGVATTGGARLPVERHGSELMVVRHALGDPVVLDAVRYARGGAPWALFGEAGREGVMKMYQAQDGRPGLRAADGAVLPLTRVEGGRLGVDAYAFGGMPTPLEVYAMGGRPPREPVAFPIGGAPASAIRASTPMQATATASAPATAAPERGPVTVEITPQIQLTVAALDPKTAADVILSQKKVIVQALAEEIARSSAVRAAIRGDRS
ncbi:MAG TPA: phage tail tape measure C-terminal domain-containing protein, partial [Vicinamibacterales bacterium]|nr:phage tail tape measure C-terminal domain-containing protein [Vicinamibacterales bacterium]